MPTSVSALLLAKMKNCVLCFLLENYKQIMPVMGRDILCSDDDNDVEVSLRNYAKKMILFLQISSTCFISVMADNSKGFLCTVNQHHD